ncbi:PAS-domain containing protein [Sneathiella chinensis]|uniref:histidine kinase n=1 Tax=Sneathiella chinensis TaxID=349750 RepID=A0ABQ5U7N4_9PROT|nr:PAS-domain containing protein [Sneathiella chinensis]GLQ07284.1 PAS domain-containing sensor histidine kinase [Sneathiella chinensis]
MYNTNKILYLLTGLFGASLAAFLLLHVNDHPQAGIALGASLALMAACTILVSFQPTQTDSSNSESSKYYSTLNDAINKLDEGFVLYDQDNRLTFFNDRLQDMFDGMDPPLRVGMKREEVFLSLLDWLENPEDKAMLEKRLERLRAGKLPHSLGNRDWNLPNGRIIQAKESMISDNNLIAIFQDVTNIRQNQQNLLIKSELLKTVFNNIQTGISAFDEDNRLLAWNEAYLRTMELKHETVHFGASLHDILVRNFDAYKLEPGKDEDLTAESFAQSILETTRTNLHARQERMTKSGRIIEVVNSPLPTGGHISTYTDITLKKSAHMMLEESESRYRKMVDLSPDAILAQKDGLIIFANVAAVKLLGARTLHDLIGTPVKRYIPLSDLDELASHLGSAEDLEPGHTLPSSMTEVIGLEGTRIDVEIEATALMYGDRPVMQLIVRDISAQKLLQKAKDEAEYASQLKGAFLANMSHELRTPLNAVIGFSEVIMDEIFGKVGSKKYIEYAHDIHASGLHLMDLINDILDLSKIEAGTQQLFEEDVDVKQLIEECLRLTGHQARTNKIDIELNISSKVDQVHADMKMLKQVLINLVTNAIKFTPAGGQVSIESSLCPNGDLLLTVSDTGIGIREEDIPKALTPFVQVDSELSRRYQGTGLGLPLSRDLVSLHGGELTLESDYGSGTTVTVRLPGKRVLRTAA